MLSTPELLVILLIIIIIFGAAKLPKLGDALGRSIKNFKSAVKEGEEGEKVAKEEKSKDSKEA